LSCGIAVSDLKLDRSALHVLMRARSLLHLVDAVALSLDELATLVLLGVGVLWLRLVHL
jgi:hypothetical protein